MPDYNLSGLSSRSFEQLIQALATKVLGPGTVLFGDGPDGGREAVFEGSVPFPANEDPWSGYIVVQAKFRQTPKGSHQDYSWLVQQTAKELRKYKKRQTPVRLPEYYIIATNLFLSSVAEVGGKDRYAKHLSGLTKTLGIRDFRVWDGDQIRAFLDDAEDIRRAYAAWVTPSDVLVEVLDQLRISSPDFVRTLTTYLQRELVLDTFVNLEQAGHNLESRTLLAKVFVDLPTARERYSSSHAYSRDEKEKSIVRLIVETGNEKLDPVSASKERAAQGRNGGGVEPGRFIILGGPGQGKSTVSQLVAQLYRFTFLQTHNRQKLSSDVREVLDELERQCNKEKITLPLARRFPLRVVLSKFAAKAGSDLPDTSLLAYLARHISDRTDRSVSPEQFRRWLATYPWILILDGLDEVPGSSNRGQVLQAVKEFLIDVANDNADILIVATTRPQGYNNDFSPEVYQHWWLVPLSVRQALHYAERLVEERYRTDEERQSRVLQRLERAAENQATERLMQSPLQITILAALLDQIGQPPRDRWLLFREYYGVIFRREMDKPTEAAGILSSYRTDVDMIHRQAGLLLQVLSEETGGTEAHLSSSELRSLVESRLADQGHENDELRSLTSKILDAAAERLVFLVGLEEGKIGFEIRSLQEFMAGEALASGEDHLVRSRLRHLGGLVHWRNVFLFVAGRCFAEREYLSEYIHLVCCQLNDPGNDRTLGTARSGSRLALELLEDGAARAKPSLARLLVREALHFLELPADDELDRLARCYDDPLRNHYEDALRHAVKPDTPFKIAAWSLLFGLAQRQIGWAEALAYENWPKEQSALTRLVRMACASLSEGVPEEWLQRVAAAVPQVSPESAFRFQGLGPAAMARLPLPRWFHDAVNLPRIEAHGRSLQLPLSIGNGDEEIGRFKASLTPVKPQGELPLPIAEMPNPNQAWRSLIAVAYFLAAPSASTLASALEQMADQFEQLGRFVGYMNLPWPIRAILEFAASKEELRDFSKRAGKGEFGDLQDWLSAEDRWVKKGASERDLLWMTDTDVPFNITISTKGVPHGAFSIIDSDEATIGQLVRVLVKLPKGRHRTWFGHMIRYALLEFGRRGQQSARLPNWMIKELLTSHAGHSMAMDFLVLSENLVELIESYGELVEQAVCSRYLYAMSFGTHAGWGRDRHAETMRTLCRLYNAAKDRRKWLLRPIAVLALAGVDLEVLVEADLSNLSDEEKAAAVLIRVVQGHFNACDARVLNNRAVRKELERIGVPTGGWRRSGAVYDSVGVDEFLHAMWASSEADESALRHGIVNALNDLIGRRKSGLLSLETWESMGLPRSLRDVGVSARRRAASR